MKVKFGSRLARGRKGTPTVATSSFVTTTRRSRNMTDLTLILCIFVGYQLSACCAQQVLWLYKLPSNALSHQHRLVHHNYIGSSDHVLGSGAMSNRDVRRLVPLLTQHTLNPQWSNYISPTQSVPLILPELGPVGGNMARQIWQQPYVPTTVNNKADVMMLSVPKSVAVQEVLSNQVSSAGASDEMADNTSTSSELNLAEFSYHPTRYSYPPPSSVVAVTSSSFLCNAGKGPGNLKRFHPETGACYAIGTQGPCGSNMIFTQTDNRNGRCECDQDSHNRPLVQVGNHCHFLYTQAICPSGYWLTLTSPNSEPACHLNVCLLSRYTFHHGHYSKKSQFADFDVLIPFKGECVPLNKPSRHCSREGEVVLFPQGALEPACGISKSRRRVHRRQISSVGAFSCGPGMRRHRITKKCVRVISRSIMFGQTG